MICIHLFANSGTFGIRGYVKRQSRPAGKRIAIRPARPRKRQVYLLWYTESSLYFTWLLCNTRDRKMSAEGTRTCMQGSHVLGISNAPEHVFPFLFLSIHANIRGVYPLKWYVSTYRPPFDAIQREFENSKDQTEENRVFARDETCKMVSLWRPLFLRVLFIC